MATRPTIALAHFVVFDSVSAMSSSRNPKSVGTYGLLDVIRRPSGRIPPDPSESVLDVRAVESGETRRVSCFLRRSPGSRLARFRYGSLEISASGVAWQPFFGIRGRASALGGTGVALVRQAERSDIRFGGPNNSHLFSLVRCTTREGRMDLLVPTADVPLVTWRLGDGEYALTGASRLRVAARPKMSTRERRWRAVLGTAFLAAAMIVIVADKPEFASLPMLLGCWLLASAVFAPRRKPSGGDSPEQDER